MSEAARAIAALRAGQAIAVGSLIVASVETAADELLGAAPPAPLLLSGGRARALGLSNQREAASGERPTLVRRPPWLTPAKSRTLVDPAQDFSRIAEGPLDTAEPEDIEAALAALGLARLAGLLPALWLLPAGAAVTLDTADAVAATRARTVTLAARAALPIEGLDAEVQICAFRAVEDGSEHVALLVGAPGGKPPLVRLHSECLTGDVFGSLKCDCGPQLRAALRLMAADGGGILLYLRQEGRGIGLVNKIRAYALQDRGLDTVEANLRIGFADDERDFALAAAMLRALGHRGVRLLTNNPAKLAGLEAEGIRATRVPHRLPANPHNAHYLAVKALKSGHLA